MKVLRSPGSVNALLESGHARGESVRAGWAGVLE